MHYILVTIFSLVMLVFTGCQNEDGKLPTASISGGQNNLSNADQSGGASSSTQKVALPKEVVSSFLENLKQGNIVELSQYLTNKARVTGYKFPAGNSEPSATYSVSDSYDGEGGTKYVRATWVANNEYGKPQTDNVTWVLKQEANQWKILGFITDNAIPGSQNTFINFEDPNSYPRFSK